MRTGTAGMDVMRTATIPVIEMAPRYGHMPTYTGIQYNTGVAMTMAAENPAAIWAVSPRLPTSRQAISPTDRGMVTDGSTMVIQLIAWMGVNPS